MGARPRERDVVGVDDVAHEASHRDAAVLDLSMTQPSDAGLLALAPQVKVSEPQRIEVTDNGVLLFGEGSKLGLPEAHRRRGGADGCGNRRRSWSIRRRGRGCEQREHRMKSIS